MSIAPETAPIDLSPSPAPRLGPFASLALRDYRRFAIASLMATIAFWMQRVAQDWLVLSISGSVAAVGITSALQFAPLLIFGLYAGVVVDRYPKRMLVLIGQLTAVATSAFLAVVTLTGTVQVWHVYLSAGVMGLASAVDWPSRQVLTSDLVGQRLLRSALGVNSSVFQLGAVVGPVIAGLLLISVGGGWSFLVTLTLAVTAASLFLTVRGAAPTRPHRVRATGALIEGLRYVRSRPAVLWTLVPLGAIALFAQNLPVHLAGFANDHFDAGAAAFSLFNSMVALGAIAGAVLSARRPRVALRDVIRYAAVYTFAVVAAAWAPGVAGFAIALVAVGFCWLTLVTAANYLVQTSSDVAIRGRVMSVYTLVLFGGQAVGGLIVGFSAARIGPQLTMTIGGTLAFTVTVSVAVALASRRGLTLTWHRPRRLPRLVIARRPVAARVRLRRQRARL